jgi:Transposase DDE domain
MTPTAGAVLERHRARMHGADELMRRRSAIVEHPFGTLKCRAGYRHFLVRGFNKVRGEWSLMALCYNFTRVLNIMGFEPFVAYVAKVLLSRLRASGAPLGAWARVHVQQFKSPWQLSRVAQSATSPRKASLDTCPSPRLARTCSRRCSS